MTLKFKDLEETGLSPYTSDDMTSSNESYGDKPKSVQYDISDEGELVKVTIVKPEGMDNTRWEKKIIAITKSFAGLGVTVRRVVK
tara:strand:- start:1791 stop:2045 length:255 start_codon:yes stop_codon:yes gene_type:complete